jgi:hypothetical protein
MARLPRSGASFSSLYEYEIMLKDVISNLGFHPAKLDIEDIQQTLNGVATRLGEVNSILAAVEAGIHHTHYIEVVGQIISALSENPEIGSVEQARNFLADFRSRAVTVGHGAMVANWLLDVLPKRSHGRVQQHWHDHFTRAVLRICELNDVAATIVTDRITRKPKGRFLEAAIALQRLLDPRMCAPSTVALAQRLERSKKRIQWPRR